MSYKSAVHVCTFACPSIRNTLRDAAESQCDARRDPATSDVLPVLRCGGTGWPERRLPRTAPHGSSLRLDEAPHPRRLGLPGRPWERDALAAHEDQRAVLLAGGAPGSLPSEPSGSARTRSADFDASEEGLAELGCLSTPLC